MDYNYTGEYLSMPLDSYQLYHDYSMWSSEPDNRNYYLDIPAFQELNRHEFVTVESMDLTSYGSSIEEEKVSNQTDSPTQAKDFKLTCSTCHRVYSSRKRFKNHLPRCKENQMKFSVCVKCGKNFKNRASLNRHTMRMHGVESSASSDERSTNSQTPQKRSIFHDVTLLALSSDRKP